MRRAPPAYWPAEKVVPLSRVIARAVLENVFPVDLVQDPVMEADVLAYAVASSNAQCETVWYLNTRGEVGQEALGLRDGWPAKRPLPVWRGEDRGRIPTPLSGTGERPAPSAPHSTAQRCADFGKAEAAVGSSDASRVR